MVNIGLPSERRPGTQRSRASHSGTQCWAGKWILGLQVCKWCGLDLLRVGESCCFREEPGPISLFRHHRLPPEVEPSLLAQQTVVMESGCHPTPLLLGRHLVARHCLLGHFDSQRACMGLSEGAQGTLEPGRSVLMGRAAPVAWVWDGPASSFSVSACPSLDSHRGGQGLSHHFTDGDK